MIKFKPGDLVRVHMLFNTKGVPNLLKTDEVVAATIIAGPHGRPWRSDLNVLTGWDRKKNVFEKLFTVLTTSGVLCYASVYSITRLNADRYEVCLDTPRRVK